MDRQLKDWLAQVFGKLRTSKALVYQKVRTEALRAEEGGSPRRGETLKSKLAEVRSLRYS